MRGEEESPHEKGWGDVTDRCVTSVAVAVAVFDVDGVGEGSVDGD